MSPSVSILLYGRDDNYAPDYLTRVKYCIQSYANALDGLDYEIVLVDFNQIPDKPLIRHFDGYKNVREVVVSRDEYGDLLKQHFDKGVRLVADKAVARDYLLDSFFSTTWATNFGLANSTKKYVIFTSPDLLVCTGLGEVLETVSPNTLYKCISAKLPYEVCFRKFKHFLRHSFDHPKLRRHVQFSRKSVYRLNVGNGQMFIIDRKSAIDVGGYLPFLMHRGKGCDLFFSYFCSALGKKSVIPRYCCFEMDHTKVSLSQNKWYNYIVKHNKKIVFDYMQEFDYLRSWIKGNKFLGRFNFFDFAFPYSIPIVADQHRADAILSAFNKISFFPRN